MLIEPRVVFFSVQTAQQKIERIIQTATEHFKKKERLLFFVEDDRALHFIDELLWAYPRESFLPHELATKFCDAWIAVTKEKQNYNQARIAFNLCPTPLLIEFSVIYDLDDSSTPQKQLFSQLRFEAYKKAQLLIESRE